MGKNCEGKEEPTISTPECCMCGDHGLSSELFTCKSCRFRSQHKYCSNLYPGAESYNTCNWCLSQKDDQKGGENNNINNNSNNNIKACPKSSHKIRAVHQDSIKMIKKRSTSKDHGDGRLTGNGVIKKQSKSVGPPPSGGRKRVASEHVGRRNIPSQRIIRRTKSEEMTNGVNGIVKQVFRNKVRRYKLLDEVSS